LFITAERFTPDEPDPEEAALSMAASLIQDVMLLLLPDQ
jgi:hypothetical protein